MPSRKGPCKSYTFSLTDDNNISIDNMGMAEHANHYFTTVGSSLADLVTVDNMHYIDQIKLTNSDSCTLCDFPVITANEVKAFIKDINLSKSANIKDAITRLLKDTFEFLVPQLNLFNLVCFTSEIPKSWKQATITPIFKEGNKAKIINYRPISLLSLPVKLFEKLIHKHKYDFIEANGLLCDEQGGSDRPLVPMKQSLNSCHLSIFHLTPTCTPAVYISILKKRSTQ